MLKTTVVGSYPRKEQQKDTLRKSTVSEEEALEMIAWAVKDQCSLGLDVITDGEAYRENMYWFYQLRMDGVDAHNKIYKQFSVGGSTEGVDLEKAHPLVKEKGGFGIECSVVTGKLENPTWDLAGKWKHAKDNADSNVTVKQTITGPHMLARFSVNQATDIYPDDTELARGYAQCIIEELRPLVEAGCKHIQFDEPVLTESPHECIWAADVINEIIEQFPGVYFGLHICGGNAHRRRGYFGRYVEMLDGLKKINLNELHLEYCTLHYNMLDLFDMWDYKGNLSIGVIDQRSDEIDTVENVHELVRPALEYFEPERLFLSSECGFGHVPLDITRAKLSVLVESAKTFRP